LTALKLSRRAQGSRDKGDPLTSSVVLQTFPHDDLVFRVHVEAAQARIGKWLRPEIEAEIRAAYPAAVVRPAEMLAQSEPGVVRWYAYRDGHFEPAAAEADWWDDPELARTVTSGDRYVEANQAAADLFGVSREEIVGARSGSFVRHENNEEVRARFYTLLAEVGMLHSTAVVVRPDGEEIPIEYRITREAPGEYVSVRRRLPEPIPAPRP
jgi:PAS domain S-box-containing protein